MGNPLKQLAGETAIYGLSTILARIINFLFGNDFFFVFHTGEKANLKHTEFNARFGFNFFLQRFGKFGE